MHTLAAVPAAYRNRLGSVDPDANRWREAVAAAMFGKRSLDRDAARERRSRLGECDEEAVTRMVDLRAPMLVEERTKRPIVPFDEPEPRFIADRFYEARRPTDVGEEERACCSVGTPRRRSSAARRVAATAPRRSKIDSAASSSSTAASSSPIDW